MVDSRKTGFAAGKREFCDTPAEALAIAEQIARQKDNEGAMSFAEIDPTQRRNAAEALAVLEGVEHPYLMRPAALFLKRNGSPSLRASPPLMWRSTAT
jgi:hypothetical protein